MYICSQNRNCLRSFGPTYDANALKPYSGKLPGELFSVDEQCARVHGQGSTMCRVSKLCTDATDILWASLSELSLLFVIVKRKYKT